ncbi:PqqD family peptide modification chaperone [Parasphingorhabdus sp. NYA22]
MSLNILMDTKFSASEQILSSDIGDEMVMMDINLGKYFSLKGPSGRVWELIGNGTTVQAIFDVLLEEYDVEAEQCQQELLALLKDLHDAEMIVAAG